MRAFEKAQLLALLKHQGNWCRDAEAHDAGGEPVHYDDPSAVAWDITGALCRLFGWQRACALFRQFDRHVNGRRKEIGWPVRDAEMHAMGALQDFNDQVGMTFEVLRQRIESMPVWHGNVGWNRAGSAREGVSMMQN
jgi:hypothetical protein